MKSGIHRRRHWVLLVVMCGSCVFSRDETVAATNPDQSVQVRRIFEGVSGCGGGGHFAILPVVAERTRFELEVQDGPRAGSYKVRDECGCTTGTGSVSISADQWLAQWQCEGGVDWVTAVPLSGERPPCFRGAERLDVSSPLSSVYPRLMGASIDSDKQLLTQILGAEGQDGLAAALIGGLASGNGTWDEAFERLDDPHRAQVLDVIRAAETESASRDVLAKAIHLEADDRAVILAAAMRLADQSVNPTGTGYVLPNPLLSKLAETRLDDLGPLNCAVGYTCDSTCISVLAATDFPCPRYETQLQAPGCAQPLCDDELCGVEQVGTVDELRAALPTDPMVAAKMVHLAAARRPEVAERLVTGLRRLTYDIVAPDCPADAGLACGCADNPEIPRHACESGTNPTFDGGGCAFSVDDEARTLNATVTRY